MKATAEKAFRDFVTAIWRPQQSTPAKNMLLFIAACSLVVFSSALLYAATGSDLDNDNDVDGKDLQLYIAQGLFSDIDAFTGRYGAPAVSDPEGALLGLYYGDETIEDTAEKLGRSVPLHLTYYDFEHNWTGSITQADIMAGRVPLVNWEIFSASLDDIINGVYDGMLAQRAHAAKNLGVRIFVDFGAEMNGDWSPWGGAQNGQSADKYVTAYRHVHDALAEADNLVWLWCPNVTDEPREPWNAALNYYPGDDYVDWTCVNGYNWGSTGGAGWQSFKEIFQDIYPELAAKNKPIMIGEMASTEQGGDKAAFIRGIVPTLKNDFPLVKGLVWFDIDKETDWRISSSPQAEAAFIEMAADPYFNIGASGARWIPLAADTWQWQLSGTVNTSYAVDAYDIDLFDSSAALIQGLHDQGRKVICCFSAGSYENWRPDSGAFNAADLGNTLDGWPGERWLDIRSANVRDIMKARFDLAMQKGCDGMEPDNVDGYTNSTGIALTAADQLAYNRFLAQEAHQRNLAVALKNDVAQAADLVADFDFAVNEQCHEYDECDDLEPFINAGKPVFNAEYADGFVNDTAARQALCEDARNRNFRTLILPLALDDSFRYSCDDDAESNSAFRH